MFYQLFAFTFVLCFVDSLVSSGYRLSIKSHVSELTRYLRNIFAVLAFLSTFILITSNRTGVDIINYSNIYYREIVFSDIREPIYTFLRIISRTSGLSFFEFRAILTFGMALFPIWIIHKFNIKPTFVLAFYLPSLMFLDSMQFRNSLALFILTWALYFLIKDNTCTWKNRLIFAAIVIIAAQFHSAFIVYLIILIATLKNNKLYTQICFIGSIVLLIITFLNGREVPLISTIYSLLLNEGDGRRYVYGSGHLIFLYPMIVHIITTGALIYFSKNTGIVKKSDGCKLKYIALIKNINIIFFVFVPFIIMNTTYYRLIRNAFFLNIIAEAIIYSLEAKKSKKILIVLVMLTISIMWLIFVTQFYSSWIIIVDPILKDGVLFWLN